MGLIGPFGFNTGLVTSETVYTQPKDSTYVQSQFRSWHGSLQERYCASLYNGTQLAGTGNFTIQSIIFNAVSPNSANGNPILAVCDGKIYKLNGSGTATDISGAAAFNAGSSSSFGNADILNGIIVIADPGSAKGNMVKWNDSGNAAALTSPDGNIVRTCNNIMFTILGSNSSSNGSRVYWSAVSDPTTWPAASYIDFRSGDGDSCVDLHYIGTDLYIFKQRSIGRLSTISQTVSGTTTLGPLTTVATGIGAANIGSVDRLPDGRLAFLGSDGHCYLFDGSVVTDISSQRDFGPNVQSFINPNSAIYLGNGCRTCVYPARNEVWFVFNSNPVGDSSGFDRAMIYDYINNRWSRFDTTLTTPTTHGSERPSVITYIPNIGINTTLNSVAPYNQQGYLITGFGGYLMIADPLTQTGNLGTTVKWQTSLLLSGEYPSFVPRSLILPYVSVSTPTSSSFTVKFAFDGGSFSGSSTINTSTTYKRAQIPINVPSGGFSTLQIQVVSSSSQGGGTTFDPFYLSDEVLT